MFSSSSYPNNFDGDLSGWDTGTITDMSYMLRATAFSHDISGWIVSGVTDMDYMFSGAAAFNQPLNNWIVSGVTDMASMFYEATAFNQPLNNWNVSGITYIDYMFSNATAFNSSLDGWNFAANPYVEYMFGYATSFNQDISNWDVSTITNMSYMLTDATAFNQDLGSWNISNVLDMDSMFSGTAMDATNYSNTLIGWAFQAPNLQSGVSLYADASYLASASSARNTTLIDTYGWIIYDGGLTTLSVGDAGLNGFEYFPNPVNDMLVLRTKNNIQNISVYNMSGREVLRKSINKISCNVDISALSPGIYLVKVTVNEMDYTVKIIKK